MKFTKKLQGLAIAAAFSMAAPVMAADIITFDTNGAGAGGAVSIVTLDQAPGNAIALGASAASAPGTNFTLLYQANLGTALNDNGDIVFTNGGGGSFFTFVAGFGETITGNTGGAKPVLTFDFNPAGTTNFFHMFAQAASGNNLTGLGFTGASPILSGHIVGAGFSSNFGVTGGGAGTNLDGFTGDNYPATDTLTGSGSTSLTIVIDSLNSSYFPDLVAGSTLAFVNTSQILPYNQANPSACFSSTGLADCTQPGVASVGAINGASGPNTMFQADANASFARVPEPMSIALLGLGLLGIGVSRRSKR